MPDLQDDHSGATDYLRFAIAWDPLPNLLRYEDRNTMAFSIEGRVPFLDHVLVEFVFRRAAELRVRDGWTKWIQRAAVAPLLPHDITWRTDKVGFETPQHVWFRDLPARFDEACDRAALVDDLADAQRIRQVSDPMLMWRWLCCASWFAIFRQAQRTAPPLPEPLPAVVATPS